ncbi:hypothetical protein GCM10011452_28170 [Gemmobacter lanyuensis]|uniref:Transcriptional regulator n=1 Tax=Gemmobacter lanyuensis TaxID=1054497 RepID=A0A918IYC8_9RHOB|nr:MucR family transcriptional regulator [Gemmobacter lanyuensis]GGW38233.1 hypothetical protein GCM10011452_28170 [Gemmobacter lanyuensis]
MKNEITKIHESVRIAMRSHFDAGSLNHAQAIDLTLALFEEFAMLYAHKEEGASACQPDLEEAKPVPAVPIEESVNDEFIVCLKCGGRFQMLKRHLRDAYAMTPDQYRNKWGLPSNYPMTSPNFSHSKGQTARRLGLGRYKR